MLDDYNLKVSYLGGFLVLVPFFVWYVGLRGNRAVRLFPSYLRPTPEQCYIFTARRHPDRRVF